MYAHPSSRLRAILVAALAATLAAAPALADDANPPEVSFEDRTTWLPNAHHLGFEATASACDEGAVTSVSVAVEGVGSGAHQGSGACMSVSETLHLERPGTYEGRASAVDDHGNADDARGEVLSRLIPFDTDSVEGYPPLEDIPETDLGTVVTIDTLNTEEGAVRGYEVLSDGHVLMSNMDEAVVAAGDWTSRLVFEHTGIGATLDVDGEEIWEGLVYRSSEKWWHIEPVPAGQGVVGTLG